MTNREVFILRWRRAIDRIGGAPALLNLPEPVKKVLRETTDLVTKVKMLEKIADERRRR